MSRLSRAKALRHIDKMQPQSEVYRMELLHQLQVEYWPIERLIPYARNARTHSDDQVDQIAESIAAFGFCNPILVDLEGEIIAGHGRVLAARKLNFQQVPVIVLKHLSPSQKRALRLADNKLALNAGWDPDLLRHELKELANQEFDLPSIGFNEEELEELLAQTTSRADPDDAPALKQKATTIPGDLWKLEGHRLLCEDATKTDSLNRVLQGERAELVFSDLPYNVDYIGKGSSQMKIANDNLGSDFGSFLDEACRSILSVSGGAIYLCMSSSELHCLYTAFTNAGGHWSTFIVWAKNLFTLGRSDYQRQYEPILYGWPEGTKHYWGGARNQGDVWWVERPQVNDLHPTMKPVALVERAIENSSRKSDVVLDPFAGSGTTMIACERTGRRACSVEIDPLYVDVAVKRWEAYTGKHACLESSGVNFAEVTRERAA
jgi:DNA modification methylase